MSDALVRAVVDALRRRGAVDGVAVDRVTVGEAAVFVELSDDGPDGDGGDGPTGDVARRAGLAHRPRGAAPDADGADVETLASWATGTAPADGDPTVARAVGVATLNALSAPFVDWRDGDPMERLPAAVDAIATVGLFRPAFRKFADVEVRVVERDPVDAAGVETPPGVTVSAYPPEEVATAMDGAAVVFVTGSTLVYGGLGDALAAAPPEATVVVVGATASVVPDPLFAAGAAVVAGAAVDDPASVRAAVRAGACGTDLHDAGLRKGVVAAAGDEGAGAALGLDPEPTPTRSDDHGDCADVPDSDETPEP
ncbi:Rossmann-like domain-containing protein [Halobaculum gomorrense]|uniref:Putative heavy-metal chelation domain-containing protein n=1 Tax=Halobaculum gomorrense TaxID=43928 RepID=A0A1M5T2E9_9EURY|nr:DUF364 domain-containing protein [Halobaculum gomorrense]SHH44915.1 hypothetical protein SAMN05443636_2614 [Halobaculum gomorrense]